MTPASGSRKRPPPRYRRPDWIGRKAVQIGFLLLFLYPFVPIVYNRITGRFGLALSSWLLPWDPLLLLGHLARGNWTAVVLGGPLLLLVLTFTFGRFFCGWICPLGTVLDLVRWPADAAGRLMNARAARRKRARQGPWAAAWFPANANGPVKYAVLAVTLAGALLSLQALGLLDPLVIVHRTATILLNDALALQKSPLRIYLSASALFLGILVLELFQPRFWCRHLCPLGALLNLTARSSLLNRRVGSACNGCGDCRRACPMRAIPAEGHDTRYGDCSLCLECEDVCPRRAITFGMGTLAGMRWQTEGKVRAPDGRMTLAGRYVPDTSGRYGLSLSRRTFVAGLAAGAAGLAVPGLARVGPQDRLIRPPGALPEEAFLRTCVLCQECVRICPATALRPVGFLQSPASAGTPQLAPRQGGCLLNTSCPGLCATVCPAGAIRKIPADKMKVGLAHVDRGACLAWDQGAKCLVCVEACPTGAAQPFHGRVTVTPEKCSGCGRCEQTCPVADGAIHVYPLA